MARYISRYKALNAAQAMANKMGRPVYVQDDGKGPGWGLALNKNDYTEDTVYPSGRIRVSGKLHGQYARDVRASARRSR